MMRTCVRAAGLVQNNSADEATALAHSFLAAYAEHTKASCSNGDGLQLG